jgi:hypothetical protein
MGNMDTFKRDKNFFQTPIRQGNPVGGYLTRTGSGLAANTWYRLMPEGAAGLAIANQPRQLNIGALRSDILHGNIVGWFVRIMNSGYEQVRKIVAHDVANTTITVNADWTGHSGLPTVASGSPPVAVEFCLYPDLINPLVIDYFDGATNDLEIGYTIEEAMTPTHIIKLTRRAPGQSFTYPYSAIDKAFYRWTSYTASANNDIAWGEHYPT